MTVTFQKAQRKNIGLLLMLAGGTGSGKTWSAMELAKGMARGQRFAVCDTERGRASMYADTFDFDVVDLEAPFTPERYLELVLAAEEKDYPVFVIDSMSHEWEGPGGLLDQHDQLMGGQESKNLSAWIKPKMAHRKFVSRLLQASPHIIMCFRAAERVEVERNPKSGKMEIVPKKSLTGLQGWLPITEKNLPFEATASFLLMAQKPGVPQPIKLPDPLRPVVPLDRPLTAQVGEQLAAWASGETEKPAGRGSRNGGADPRVLTTELLDLGSQLGIREDVAARVASNRHDHSADPAAHLAWLKKQATALKRGVAERAKQADDDIPVPDAAAALAGVGAEDGS